MGLLDIPVAGAVVSIQGTNAFTASDGSFTVGGVAVPYDLAVIQHGTTPSTGYAHVFQGLTTSNPTVLPVSVLSGTGTPQSATITGTLGSAVATGYTAKVCASGVSVVVFGCATVPAGGTSFSLPAAWGSGPTVVATVRVLEVQTDASGVATGYGRYGTASVTLSNGGSTPVTVNLGTGPAPATLSANVTVPSGYSLNSISVSASLDAMSSLSLFGTTSVSSFTGWSRSSRGPATPSSRMPIPPARAARRSPGRRGSRVAIVPRWASPRRRH